MNVAQDVVGFIEGSGRPSGWPFGTWAVESLEYEIRRWAANLTAADAYWLRMIAEFDRRQGWIQHGSVSCAKWLQNTVGLDRSTAHEKVRVARALDTFPGFALAMSAGVLSYAKVRSITRVATAENAAMLLEMALERSSHQVERFVAAYRRCEATEDDVEARAFAERSLSYRTDESSMVITIRVPVEAGAAFLAAVDRFVNNTELEIPQVARRADAAIEMAEHAVATIDQPGAADGRYLVTLHLTPDVFALADSAAGDRADARADATVRDDVVAEGMAEGVADGRGDDATAEDERSGLRPDRDRRNVCCVAPGDGLAAHPAAVSLKTAERMLCDAVLQGYDIDRAGPVGADHRFPSAKLKRAIRLRDGGCVAPGCDRLGWLDSHHIIHWTNDGPTIASNLVSLCRFQHRLMHEGGWRITGNANVLGGLTFHRPDGTIAPAGQQLLAGHRDPVDIGCTPEALLPGASVQEQLEIIEATKRLRERCRTLGRERSRRLGAAAA